MNSYKCEHTIEKCSTVSFDVFDTLVCRCVGAPSAVFERMENELCRKYGVVYEGFAGRRIQAEADARAASSFEEITIDEIYRKLDIKERELVKEFEKQIEIELSEPNTGIKEVYEACINKGKRVVICSDMYLDRDR